MSILVTGGAGYIGSHMVYALLDRGERVVIIDNLSTGMQSVVAQNAMFIRGDIGDTALVRRVAQQQDIEAAIHFAGSVVVPESVSQPLLYYQNNTCASANFITACVNEGMRRFIFSSTAAVYGVPAECPVPENSEKQPVNPYGRSKLMIEWMLEDASRAGALDFIALRYFNVAGADLQGRTGQSSQNATHLIKRACQAALGRISHLDVFGTDYPTPDGTGVRDFIHVADLVNAHLLALDALRTGHISDIYNAGYGRGFSVRDVIAAVERETGRSLSIRESPRRAGDPPSIVADPTRLREKLGWTPEHDDLSEIVRSAYLWESRLNS